MHQSISTMIATSLCENPPIKYEDISNLVFDKCMAAQYDVRSTVNMSINHTPGELAFGRDMILPIPSKLNWNKLFQCKQDRIFQNKEKKSIQEE